MKAKDLIKMPEKKNAPDYTLDFNYTRHLGYFCKQDQAMKALQTASKKAYNKAIDTIGNIDVPVASVKEIDKTMQHILYTFIWKKKDVFILGNLQWHELRYELATHLAKALTEKYPFVLKEK